MKDTNKIELSKEDLQKLKKTLKVYTNYYKVLYRFNQPLAEEFIKKNQFYQMEKYKKKSNKKHSDECSHENKSQTKIYIIKEKMNNIEKNLYDISSSFYYQSNLNELLLFLSNKYKSITAKGLSQGMSINDESKRHLMHHLLLEGVPCYILDKLKNKLKQYEGSISEQPMLLAHPSNVKDKSYLNFLMSDNVKQIIENDYTIITNKIYDNIENYNLFNAFKYLYLEGHFEDYSNNESFKRTDFLLSYHINFFDNTKHQIISKISQMIYALPFELNMKYPNFQLQTNDYFQCSYFRENHSYINKTYESSFNNDTGKKLTYMLVLFSNETELNNRKIEINLYSQSNEKLIKKVVLDKPLTGVLFKTRKIIYEIPNRNIPFIIISYYIHGPIDKSNYSC